MGSTAFVGPYLLKRILEAFGAEDPAQRQTAYVLITVALFAKLGEALLDFSEAWHSRRAYERIRGTLFCITYEKALRRKITGVKPSHAVQAEQANDGDDDKNEEAANVGRIINIMRGDSYGIAQW